MRLANGELLWLGEPLAAAQAGSTGAPPLALRRWHPATGASASSALGLSGHSERAVNTPDGIVLLEPRAADAPPSARRAMLITPDGKRVSSQDPLLPREDAHWLVLADRSVLVWGGERAGQRVAELERIRWAEGQLRVTRFPPLPGPLRRGVAAVALADGRAMWLGGSPARYRGCMGCLADTWLLDVARASWAPGPPMGQPRAEHSATRLPDGSVLVAGGWSPGADWSEGPSAAVERWDPQRQRFEPQAPLPVASAAHRALWMPGASPGSLLLMGGSSRAVQAWDVGTRQWRMVAALPTGPESSERLPVPFAWQGRAWLWLAPAVPAYLVREIGRCAGANNCWALVPLLLGGPGDAADASLQGEGVALYRSAATFVPPQGTQDALLLGGALGEQPHITAAADALSLSGRHQVLPPLLAARNSASAVRLPGGVLVLGGWGGAANARDHERPVMPAEWLASGASAWQAVTVPDGAWLSDAQAWGDDADGQAGWRLGPAGQVQRFTLAVDDTSPATPIRRVLAEPWPSLRRDRSDGAHIRGLADGRVVVAGGSVQVDKIALQPASDATAATPDRYVGIGEFLPSRRHEIWEPTRGQWRDSAPSRAPGGPVAILDDGRVVKLGRQDTPAQRDSQGREQMPARSEFVLEISSADGRSWRTLNGSLPAGTRLLQESRVFGQQGELFLATEGRVSTGGQPSALLWFDEPNNRWLPLWEARSGDNWRAHWGRVISRTLPNGKRVVLPVEGGV